MDIKKLEKFLIEKGEPGFRFKQICQAVFKDGMDSFLNITTVSKELRENLNQKFKILPFEVVEIIFSKRKDSFKALLKLEDGNVIETVLLSPQEGHWSACISSQVGCPLGCAFCMTGKSGFIRNLSGDEIASQILFWRQFFKKEKISGQFLNIVYMGMGEPFLNWENVKESLNNLIDSRFYDFGRRNIAVSTVGIVEEAEKFAKDFPQVNLAISLHFADDEKRKKYMPINKKYNLNDLKEFLRSYVKTNTRKVFIEYILLSGINDSLEDALLLAKFLKSIGKMQMIHVNLIRYNSIGGEFRSSSKEATNKFRDYLKKEKVHCTIRKNLGEDIQGACGQLAGKVKNIF